MTAARGEPLPLGIVSDEIAPDFRTAARHGISWGIARYEIRCLASGRVPDVRPDEWREAVAAARDQALQITALSPGIFKHTLDRRDELERELNDVLPRTIGMAAGCGAALIIVFGVQRRPEDGQREREEVVGLLRRAAQTAAAAGMRIAIENEPGFHCDTGAATRAIIDEADSRALGANWDPCNAFGTDEIPYPVGYEAIRPVILNVHAKDTARGSLIQCVPIGEGAIDWAGQVRALVADGVVSHITIETHCLPLVEQSEKNVRALRELIAAAAPAPGR